MIETQCPCCGQKVSLDKPLVDLNINVISFRGAQIKVRPKVAEFVSVLAARHPASTPRSRLIAALWGNVEPESSESCVRLLAYQARLAMVGWQVTVNGSRAGGYRMIVG